MFLNKYMPNGMSLARTIALTNEFHSTMFLKATLKSILKNKQAFTLAETLITMTIIGVIATMTVPTLHANLLKHSYAVGLKKAYNQLSNIVKIIPLENNCSHGDYQCALDKFYSENTKVSESGYNYFEDGGIQLLAPHFKTIKTATAKEGGRLCNSLAHADEGGCIYTADGMMYGSSHGTVISVDVNGEKGPNVFGRDRFRFYVALTAKNGIPEGTLIAGGSKIYHQWTGSTGGTATSVQRTNCTVKNISTQLFSDAGGNCTAQVLEDGKMDY